MINRLKRWFALAACLLLATSLTFAQSAGGLPGLFAYQPGDPATDLQSGVRVIVNSEVVARSLPGYQVEFQAPSGNRYVFVTDTVTTTKTGNSHWVAHVLNGGNEFRAVISYGNGIGFGLLATPDGNFRLDTLDGQLRLIDLKASSRQLHLFDDEPLIPPIEPKPSIASQSVGLPRAEAGPVSGPYTVDLLVLYTNGLANKLGLDAVQTRIEHLVALTNQAYIDSQVNIQLRLVHTAQVNASDHVTHQSALTDLRTGVAPFDNAASLRSAYGADLVTLLNQFDTSADPTVCGQAYLLGSGGGAMSAGSAYSVVSVGDDVAGTNGYCGDYTLAHELGHNMGSVHDRANATSPGAYAFSYGYGISGKFGDIMSYISPRVGKFSNPAITCDSSNDPCGISETDPVNGANNALSLNNTAPTVSAFFAPTGLDTTPDHFSFTTLAGVNGGDTLVSEAIVVSGLSASAGISISGGEYSVNGAAFTSVSSMVSNGQIVQVRVMASATPYATASAMLTIGTLSQAFRVITRPTVISNSAALAAGFQHSLALRSDGTVWSWGDNSAGQLGDGTLVNHSSPALVSGINSVAAIAAGGTYSLALRSDGNVWGWGSSTVHQLGGTAGATNPLPIQIGGLSNISRIAAGYWDALAIDNSSAVWYWGNWNATPTKVSAVSNATGVAVGNSHRLVLLNDRSMRAWGDNTYGQLGIGSTSSQSVPTLISTLTNVSAISAGARHSLALRADGTVWAWGDNTYGQLGDGTVLQRTLPVAVTDIGGAGQLGSVVAIVAGQFHSMAIKSDGSVVVWGQNTYSQLGDATTQNRTSPVALPLANVGAITGFTAHSLAIENDGSVWAWGYNAQGQLGEGATKSRQIPVSVGGAGWSIGGGDMEPAPLSFANSSGPPGTAVVSSPVTIGGITQGTPISIIGGEYSINGGPYVSTIGTVLPGQVLTVRVTAAADVLGLTSAVLTVGGVSARFTVTSAPVSPPQSLNLAAGWNLLGNSLNQALSVEPTFADTAVVTTVWKWDVAVPGWQFYAPSMTTAALQTYATSKGYGVLSVINPGEGYWVNAKLAASLTNQAGTAFTLGASNLTTGWNLVATGNDVTPSAFNTSLSATPPSPGVIPVNLTTLWAWDNPLSQWYFYAPSLEANGTLATYITGKGYLDFTQHSKSLGNGVGFWVNRP